MSSGHFTTKIASEIEVEVWYDWQPEEKQTRDYPGCAEEIAITDVYVDGDSSKCILEALCAGVIDALVQELYDSKEDPDPY